MTWRPRERDGEWQRGDVGREVRAKRRVQKLQGSRGPFSLGMGSGGGREWQSGCGGPGCKGDGTGVGQRCALCFRPGSPGRT